MVGRGAGLDYAELRRMSMFPELVKAACSMVGAWGGATPNGTLVQLRALDWDTTTTMQNYPLLLVYQPSDKAQNAFATLGWPGFMGAITGVSSAALGVCEKVWLGYDGVSTRFGEPFHFVLRDILQFDRTNAQAVQVGPRARASDVCASLTSSFSACSMRIEPARSLPASAAPATISLKRWRTRIRASPCGTSRRNRSIKAYVSCFLCRACFFSHSGSL